MLGLARGGTAGPASGASRSAPGDAPPLELIDCSPPAVRSPRWYRKKRWALAGAMVVLGTIAGLASAEDDTTVARVSVDLTRRLQSTYSREIATGCPGVATAGCRDTASRRTLARHARLIDSAVRGTCTPGVDIARVTVKVQDAVQIATVRCNDAGRGVSLRSIRR